MKKKQIAKNALLTLLMVTSATVASGQNEASGFSVIHETDTVWNFGYKGVNLAHRKMHRIDIAYPSKDAEGNDVTLSGYVAIPSDIYEGGQPCDGILLYNHYTQLKKSNAPTRGYSVGEDMIFANPLKPNYIVVTSDFQGFGVSDHMPQAYCFGDCNGRASIDMLLAARKMLDERGVSQGKFLINAGYSSGGYDAVAAQRVRDLFYRDQIHFDKTLTGGMPFDVIEGYREYINLKDDPELDGTCLPIVLEMYNRHAKLGYTFEEMFKEPYANKFKDWFFSGEYSMEDIMDSLKNTTLSSIVQDNFLSTSSDEFKKIKDAAEAHSLSNGWVPDSTQKYYAMHLLHDNVVPINSGRAFLQFLSEMSYDGKKPYVKSLVPERTKLQTNFIIPAKQHTIVGGILFYINLAATLTAYPVLYYDGELNTYYADLVADATLMGIIHKLEEKGFDVKGAVQKLTSGNGSGQGGSIFDVLASIETTLNSIGTNTSELLQMANDCGLTIVDILQIYAYLTTPEPTPAEAPERNVLTQTSANGEVQAAKEVLLIDYYQQQLFDWLKANNVDIYEEEK